MYSIFSSFDVFLDNASRFIGKGSIRRNQKKRCFWHWILIRKEMEVREWEVNLIIIEEIDRNREEVRIYVRIIFSSIFIRFSILIIASLYLFNIYKLFVDSSEKCERYAENKENVKRNRSLLEYLFHISLFFSLFLRNYGNSETLKFHDS